MRTQACRYGSLLVWEYEHMDPQKEGGFAGIFCGTNSTYGAMGVVVCVLLMARHSDMFSTAT